LIVTLIMLPMFVQNCTFMNFLFLKVVLFIILIILKKMTFCLKVMLSAFQEKLNEVLQEQGDVRHMVAIPSNPKLKKLDLSQDEKESRIVEVTAKAREGLYFKGEILEDIADKMLSKLWNINLD